MACRPASALLGLPAAAGLGLPAPCSLSCCAERSASLEPAKHGQIYPSIYWSSGQTRHIHNFVLSRHKLRDDATCPPPKPVKPVSSDFEVKPVKSSRTLPHDVTDSPVLRPNRSNRRCRRVSDLPPSLDAFESFARACRMGCLLDSPSSSPTWPTLSSSPCTLLFRAPCAHYFARPPRIPRFKPTRIHPSPSWSLDMNLSLLRAYLCPSFTTVLQHESFF